MSETVANLEVLEASPHLERLQVVVVDDQRVFMTSANLTSRAMDRNVEAGLLVFDRELAQSTVARFQTLIDHGMVMPLPAP